MAERQAVFGISFGTYSATIAACKVRGICVYAYSAKGPVMLNSHPRAAELKSWPMSLVNAALQHWSATWRESRLAAYCCVGAMQYSSSQIYSHFTCV